MKRNNELPINSIGEKHLEPHIRRKLNKSGGSSQIITTKDQTITYEIILVVTVALTNVDLNSYPSQINTIDTLGEYVLLVNQSDAKENGIYIDGERIYSDILPTIAYDLDNNAFWKVDGNYTIDVDNISYSKLDHDFFNDKPLEHVPTSADNANVLIHTPSGREFTGLLSADPDSSFSSFVQVNESLNRKSDSVDGKAVFAVTGETIGSTADYLLKLKANGISKFALIEGVPSGSAVNYLGLNADNELITDTPGGGCDEALTYYTTTTVNHTYADSGNEIDVISFTIPADDLADGDEIVINVNLDGTVANLDDQDNFTFENTIKIDTVKTVDYANQPEHAFPLYIDADELFEWNHANINSGFQTKLKRIGNKLYIYEDLTLARMAFREIGFGRTLQFDPDDVFAYELGTVDFGTDTDIAIATQPTWVNPSGVLNINRATVYKKPSCVNASLIINQTGGGLPSGTINDLLRHDGTDWVASQLAQLSSTGNLDIRPSSGTFGIYLESPANGIYCRSDGAYGININCQDGDGLLISNAQDHKGIRVQRNALHLEPAIAVADGGSDSDIVFKIDNDGSITSDTLANGSNYLLKADTNGKIETTTISESDITNKYQHDGYLDIAGSATSPNGTFEILTGSDFTVPRAGTYKLRMVYFMKYDSPFATNIYVRIGTTSLLSPATITTAWGHAEIKETEIANTSMVHTPIDLSVGNGYLVNITPAGPGWISLELTAHIDVTLAGEIQIETMSSTTEYTFQLKEGSFIDVREL